MQAAGFTQVGVFVSKELQGCILRSTINFLIGAEIQRQGNCIEARLACSCVNQRRLFVRKSPLTPVRSAVRLT